MKKYTSLLFDAFDTVFAVNRARLPVLTVNGQPVQTTSESVRPVYEKHFGPVDPVVFYRALSNSFAEIERRRLKDNVEIPSRRRFELLLRLLDHEPLDVASGIADELVVAHMNCLDTVLEVPGGTIDLLSACRQDFVIGMVSNFDYAPVVHDVLRRSGISGLFDTVVVSIELGWRKPDVRIFEHALERLQQPASTSLFIGDQLHLDVLGAHRAGIDVAWLDTGREVLTDDYPEPEFRIRSLSDVRLILSGELARASVARRNDGGPIRILEE